MLDYMVDNASEVRFICFIAAFMLCAIWEQKIPRRTLTLTRRFRWFHNLSLLTINSALIALLVPLATIQAATIADDNQWGALHYLSVPWWANLMVSLLLLDLLIYAQHRLFHMVPYLWKLHRVHHSDLDVDVTTAIRFHPIEMILSLFLKIMAIFILGVSPIAIIIFEILLNVSAMFNHSNGRLVRLVDKKLRWFIVTPDMHRIHHSINLNESHSNFGFFLSIWDHSFKTHQAKSEHEKMIIGIKEIRSPEEQTLFKLLMQPFRFK
ncbi:sterol desaturase family protein [Vibrio sagamiensis]|uniref:Sterol desaturase n=1 Tax=Vibrio sagamiensis NBRC 104589 TaxID=1219064 RepID=A0A511QB89_9VIBR|nr:sterol desaturase family protein [Vibrio sagamiensis]GEM74560.1 sterol desaturase [Vibrio sagamiensis NBRC 104589]